MDNWRVNFRLASTFPNVYCKLSGMVTEADWKNWKPSDLRPYIDLALEFFGPNRCMYGSDWPVCELAAPYQDVHGVLREELSRLSKDEQAAIFGGNAIKFYKLPIGS
jgi:L-fuconolactonase